MTVCLQQHDDALHGVHDTQTVEQRLAQAAQSCLQSGTRLTPLRREVLELILTANAPVGAYDLLASMKRDGERPPAPPTVYRTLDFLLEQGFIHRLASINAYIPCCHPRAGHQAAFLICQHCQQVRETSASHLMESLDQVAASGAFQAQHAIIEISGLCQHCQP
ncbi:transcriptional repressor [Alkanindiges sp. WGS2144]|uniref:transcriptional repressor n=1 Tax=Alkanindiges sp. WGS2144 TaxID=3366808 RepID=UPI003753D257